MPKPGALGLQFVIPLAAYMALHGASQLNASTVEPSNLQDIDSTPDIFQRQYKVTAFVTLLSIPILSRSGVGFGAATVEQQTKGKVESISLRFLGASIPERAHGLNRFGLIQEKVREVDQKVVDINYLGLMTANGEESLKDAQQAIDAQTGDQARFVLARAVVDRDGTRYATKRMLLPLHYRSFNADQLLRDVENQFGALKPNNTQTVGGSKDQPILTFLCTLREMMQSDRRTLDRHIIFNGQTFQFHSSKRPDTETGADLKKLGITTFPDKITQLEGRLRNEKTKESTNFRLWFERGTPNFLPLRFEFKAKSYLRLVFDADSPLVQASAVPALRQ